MATFKALPEAVPDLVEVKLRCTSEAADELVVALRGRAITLTGLIGRARKVDRPPLEARRQNVLALLEQLP
jgi:hypothetical protein